MFKMINILIHQRLNHYQFSAFLEGLMSQSHAMFVESKDKVLNWVYDMAFVADPTSAPNDFNISV